MIFVYIVSIVIFYVFICIKYFIYWYFLPLSWRFSEWNIICISFFLMWYFLSMYKQGISMNLSWLYNCYFLCIYLYKIFYILIPPPSFLKIFWMRHNMYIFHLVWYFLSMHKQGISMKLSWLSNMQLYEIVSIFKTKSFVLFRSKINIHIALKWYFFGGGRWV